MPQEVKKARLHAVEQLEAGISGRINERLVGTEVDVLVEGQKTKSNSEPAWYGRTRGNKLVHFRGAAQAGELVTVRIERASPWSLVGTPAGVVARAGTTNSGKGNGGERWPAKNHDTTRS